MILTGSDLTLLLVVISAQRECEGLGGMAGNGGATQAIYLLLLKNYNSISHTPSK